MAEVEMPKDPIVMVPTASVESQSNKRNVPLDMKTLLNEDISIPSSQQLEIAFQDLQYSVQLPKKKGEKVASEKVILKGCSGIFRPGKLTAVMGASGAGKTSLLQILAGETNAGTVTGSLLVNGVPVTGSRIKQMSGFVFQDDVLLGSMTVREAITMAAKLRLPSSVSAQEKEKRVNAMIRLLNLEKAQNTMVGDANIKGVSGGEKKRTAMAMEFISNPAVLFLDEPTSGLDTFTAFSVVKSLKGLASTGRTIISTIHQPSSEIFHLFDDLILMAEGKIVYIGPIEQSISYFADMGYVCPKFTNPSDYIFMSILNTDVNIAPNSQARIEKVITGWEVSPKALEIKKEITDSILRVPKFILPDASIKSQADWIDQYKYLFGRASKNAFRNPFIVTAKAGQTLVFSFLIGLLYYRTDLITGFAGHQNRSGLLFFLIINNVFSSAFGVLSVFSTERRVFAREYGAGYYKLSSYFMSKIMVETPFYFLIPWFMTTVLYWTTGLQNLASKYFIASGVITVAGLTGFALGIFFACLFGSLELALTVTPLVLLPLILFSGLFANAGSIPVYFDWIKHISPMKYGYEALFKNEYNGIRIACKIVNGVPTVVDGAECIGVVGFEDNLSILACAMILFGMMIAFMCFAYIALYRVVSKENKTIDVKSPEQQAKP